MARAHRYFIPGLVWHLTHRCHKREFLLKFARDRGRWLQWLYKARRRYGLTVLNYCVTSNHVHLLVYDGAGGNWVAQSVQLLTSRTRQEYNRRKCRKGAFWEDRYHATAIEDGEHLLRCNVNPQFPGDLDTRFVRPDLHPYFGALEMLRGHLYRCLSQVASVAKTNFPKISDHMRYEENWQLGHYKQPGLIDQADAE